MRQQWRFGADIRLRVTSSDINRFLRSANEQGIHMHSVRYMDDLTVTFTVSRQDVNRISVIASKRGDELVLSGKQGFAWHFGTLAKRPVLVLGVSVLLFLICWLPQMVLFVEVEGNETIPSKEILEQAASCGIRFGASRRTVRSERMKNRLLQALPGLQWAGINTYGCRAVISVEEQSALQPEIRTNEVSSIVAVRDGIIESCTVTKGNGLCQPGQAVSKGEILISGLTDCGITVKATSAEGEVFATTQHQITVVTPLDYTQKGAVVREERKYGLRIGKKHIFFCKDSGISYAGCDKMYKEYCLSLPGGFRLPVAWIVEEYCFRDGSDISTSASDAFAVAESFAESYLRSTMISGRVLSFQTSQEQVGDLCVLRGEYACSEMIGRVHYEEIITEYGKNS